MIRKSASRQFIVTPKAIGSLARPVSASREPAVSPGPGGAWRFAATGFASLAAAKAPCQLPCTDPYARVAWQGEASGLTPIPAVHRSSIIGQGEARKIGARRSSGRAQGRRPLGRRWIEDQWAAALDRNVGIARFDAPANVSMLHRTA